MIEKLRLGISKMVVEYQSYEFKKSEEESIIPNNDSGVVTGRENMLSS